MKGRKDKSGKLLSTDTAFGKTGTRDSKVERKSGTQKWDAKWDTKVGRKGGTQKWDAKLEVINV